MATVPKASWMCATYRRPELLEELLFCFIAQDWPNKELVIVQDEAEQELVCDHPDVRIINWPKRIAPLGLKRNFAVSQCTGDFVFHVDDDDLYLPNKTRQGIENASPMGVFKSDLALIDTEPMELIHGRMPSNYMYSHRAFAMSSGYMIYERMGGDLRMMDILDLFMERLGDRCGAVDEPTYIYRRNTTPWHVTTSRTPYPGDKQFRRGRIALEPRRPEIDIFSAAGVDKGRTVNQVFRFPPGDMDMFRKGIKPSVKLR